MTTHTKSTQTELTKTECGMTFSEVFEVYHNLSLQYAKCRHHFHSPSQSFADLDSHTSSYYKFVRLSCFLHIQHEAFSEYIFQHILCCMCAHKEITAGNAIIHLIYILLTISILRGLFILQSAYGGCSPVYQRPMTQGHMSNKTILPLID